jgi:N-acetylneuraminic acid mutarotase
VWFDPSRYFYVRPFTIYDGVVIYGETVEIFIGNLWKRVPNLPGGRLTNAVSFVIDDRAYIVTGARKINSTLGLAGFTAAVVVCDPAAQSYTLDIDNPFPGQLRIDAVAFVLNGKGYVGSGRDSANTILTDFWSYDPSFSTNRWQQVDSIPLRVYDAISFVIESEGKAYVGSGNTGTSNETDFKPTTEMRAFDGSMWQTGIPNGDLVRLANAVGWTVNDTPFVATGHQNSLGSPHLRSVYKFQMEFKDYLPKYEGAPRQSAIAFAIGSRGYVGTGSNQKNGMDPTYRYFFVLDIEHRELGWRKIDNPGNALYCGSTAFSLHGKGYMCGGLKKFEAATPLTSDEIWEYTPSPNN